MSLDEKINEFEIVDNICEDSLSVSNIKQSIKELMGKPIDELCDCSHSKKSHGRTNLDCHGGECNQCGCSLYTWEKFVFMDIKEIFGKGLI